MITVITGPPCSGKSTYVREHAKPGDVVIDFDQICQALGGGDHDQAEHLREITAAAWAAAVRRAVQLHQGHHAWIIDSRPRPERTRDYQQARAAIVRLTADRDELHRRATAAGRPAGDHKRIDDYLAQPPYPPAGRPAATPPRRTVTTRDPRPRSGTSW